jgi:hypothetical protein
VPYNLVRDITEQKKNVFDVLQRPFVLYFLTQKLQITDETSLPAIKLSAYGVDGLANFLSGKYWCKATGLIPSRYLATGKAGIFAFASKDVKGAPETLPSK